MFEVTYYVELLFVCITVPIYVFILFCIFKDWRGKSGQEPFFKLCFVNGIIDIISLLNNNIGNVMPKACILPEFFESLGSGYLHIYFLIAWGGGMCQGFCVVIIALNRLNVIIYPDRFQKIWRSPYIYFFHFLQVVPGVLTGATTFFLTVAWQKEDPCSLVGYIIEIDVIRVYFKIAAVFLFSTAVILILIYSTIFYRVKNTHKNNFLFTVTKTKEIGNAQFRRELRLLTMSVIICAVQILYTVYIVIREIFGIDENYIGLNLFMDLCTGINPYLLLIFSNAVRARAKEMIGMKDSKVLFTAPPSRTPRNSQARILVPIR